MSQAGKPILHPPPQAHRHMLDRSRGTGASAGHTSPPPCCCICSPEAQKPKPPFILSLSFFHRAVSKPCRSPDPLCMGDHLPAADWGELACSSQLSEKPWCI